MRARCSTSSIAALLLAVMSLAIALPATAGAAGAHHRHHIGPRLRACLQRAAHHHRHHPRSARARQRRHRRLAAERHACWRAAHRRHRRRLAALRRHRQLPRHSVRSAPRSSAPSTSPRAERASAAGWQGFGVGNWPSGGWRPYADSSPFNRPLGNAATHPRSAQLVARALQWGSPSNLIVGSADTTGDYGHPVYWAQPTDPTYVLHATASWGRASIEGMRIHVPAGARPAGGSDGHMTIVQPDGWEYDLWQAQPLPTGSDTLSFAWGGRVRIDGDGLGSPATAAHYGSLAGIIRPEELAAGRIDHALFIVLKCTGTDTSFGYGVKTGASAYVYPAAAGGSRCADADAPPMGTRFALDLTDAQIAASPVPAWKKTILTALAHYGGYVGDTGGPGFGLVMQSGSTYTSFGVADPFVALARSAGASTWQGRYVLNLPDGVDWAHHLRVVVPPNA